MNSDQSFNEQKENTNEDMTIISSSVKNRADETIYTDRKSRHVDSYELKRKNLASFTLIWYDDMDNILTEKHQEILLKLRQSINFVVTIDNIEECENFIQQVKYEKVVLIISNTTYKELLCKIHDLQQVIAIYIYDMNNELDDELCLRNYEKVKGVFIDSDSLILKISQDQIKRDRNERTITTTVLSSINSSNQTTNNQEKTHNKLDGNFLWSKLFISVLLRLRNEDFETSLNEMINLCLEQYSGNDIQCNKISQFKKSYKSSDAIMWYTKEPFIYQLLNKALRIQDIDIVYIFRFLLRDLSEQIQEEQIQYCIQLEQKQSNSSLDRIIHSYRGQLISIEELEKFQTSVGQDISVNTFFSTSKNKQVGLTFAQSNDNINSSQIPILFIIESDIDSLIFTAPFADIHHLSQFDDEEEVLFMIGATFRIVAVQLDADINNLWTIKLILCDEKSNELFATLQELRQKLLPEKTDCMSIGNILMEMGLFDKAEEYYQRYLRSSTEENIQNLSSVYKQLAIIAEIKGDHNLTQMHWKTATDMYVSITPHLDNSKIDILHQLNDQIFDNSKSFDFDQLFSYLQTAFYNDLATFGHDHLFTANNYEVLGILLRMQRKFEQSLENYYKCLAIELKLLPNNHPKLAKTYEFIGDLHVLTNDQSQGLISYQNAITIKIKSLPDNHIEIANLYKKVALVYDKYLQNYESALENYNIALMIYLKIFPLIHEKVQEINEEIKQIIDKQNRIKNQ